MVERLEPLISEQRIRARTAALRKPAVAALEGLARELLP
jgi:hypothetical protein